MKKGFTLVELMVSVSIFTVVAVIAVGAVLTANRLNQKAQAMKQVMDNLNFALDSMTLKMKKGGGYYCASDFSGNPPIYPVANDSQECPDGNVAMAFRLEDGTEYIYRFNGSSLQFSQALLGAGSMSSYVDLTSSDIAIDATKSKFFVFDVNQADKQPRILINLYGKAQIGHESSDFAVETAVSDRR